MAIRYLEYWLAAMALIMPVAAARAGDTNISGAELLSRCAGTPELMRSDTLYCKGYLEGIEDMVAETRMQAKPADFCVPGAGVSDEELRQAFMKWGKAHASEMRQSARAAALAALRATYPCQ